jgi:hypothetical protein
MAPDEFYEEEGSRLLTPHAFEFVLDSELKRAVRSQSFLTLVVLETRREWDGITVTADHGTVEEMAEMSGTKSATPTSSPTAGTACSPWCCSTPTTTTRPR